VKGGACWCVRVSEKNLFLFWLVRQSFYVL
jgi:hypothetical protein